MPRVWHFPDPRPIFGQSKPELKNCFRRWPLPIIPPKAALSFIKLPVWVIEGRFRICYCFRYSARRVFRIPEQELLGQGTCLMLLNLGEISRNVHFVAGVDCWIALFLRRNLRVVKRFTSFKLQDLRLKRIIRLRSCLRFISVDVTCLGFISLDVTCPGFMLFVTRPPSTTFRYPDYWDLYSGFQSVILVKNKSTNLHGM